MEPNITIPTLLVRKEDGYHFLPNNLNDEISERDLIRILKPISLFDHVDIIPKPEWKCDKQENDYCVELAVTPEGYLAGNLVLILFDYFHIQI